MACPIRYLFLRNLARRVAIFTNFGLPADLRLVYSSHAGRVVRVLISVMAMMLNRLPVNAETLNVIEKSGVGRSMMRLLMYTVSGKLVAVASRSVRGVFKIDLCSDTRLRISYESKRAGGKSKPLFASAGNSSC